MPSSHPILCPNGCYHLLNAPSLPLTKDSGSNFRLPFHPHYCPNLGWLHHLCRGIIQQPNLTPSRPPSQMPMPFTPGHLFPGARDGTVPLTTSSISGYNFLFFQPSHASFPQHRFFNVTEPPPPSPIQFLYPPVFSYAIKLLLPFPVWIPCLIIWTVFPMALLIPLCCFPSIIIVQQNLNLG